MARVSYKMLIMRRRAITPLLLIAGVLSSPSTLFSQEPRGKTGTLREIVADVANAATVANFESSNPVPAKILDSALTRLRMSHAADYSFAELAFVIASTHPSFTAIARWEPDRYDLRVEPEFLRDIRTLRGVANNQLADVLTSKLGRSETNRLLARVDSLHDAILLTAQTENLEKLRRYEIKYGPKSPRLNAPEVGLNYLAQQLPGFRPNRDGWPSPLEIVATYSTTELTVHRNTDNKLRAHVVSAAHFGIRSYQFRKGWGSGGGLTGIIKPSHISAGATLMGPTDEALGNPFQRRRRAGGFLSWGDFLVGFVGGRESRFLLSRNFKVIPYLF
jgi:hypothetical protein